MRSLVIKDLKSSDFSSATRDFTQASTRVSPCSRIPMTLGTVLFEVDYCA